MLSGTKSLVTASTDELGLKMQALWAKGGSAIKHVKKVKTMGVGLGAGVRRNVDVAKHRLKMMRKRIPRFRRLRKMGISTSRLLRTGAKVAMTYGGPSSSHLLLHVPLDPTPTCLCFPSS